MKNKFQHIESVSANMESKLHDLTQQFTESVMIPIEITVSNIKFGSFDLNPLKSIDEKVIPDSLSKRLRKLRDKHQLIKPYNKRIPRKLKKKLKQ